MILGSSVGLDLLLVLVAKAHILDILVNLSESN